MRPVLLTLLLASLPLLFGWWVNASAPHRPTQAYVPSRCTRYCTTHGCRHATRANSPAYFRLRPLYHKTVAALMAGGRGLYAAVNIAVYIILVPSLLLWLAHGALRNCATIRQLKRQRAR